MQATTSTKAAPTGGVYRPGDAGYSSRRSGFNLALQHDPALIVDVASPADVAAAVRLAHREGRPMAVMNTGHGPSVPADGAVLIRTGRLRGVTVDPRRRLARVEGGARWREVIEAAAPYGLAPLNGSSPAVGAVGYTLGGGVGLLARRFGFAADHVCRFEIVTADGAHRDVSAERESDLFWALRGAGANFGVVTAMEIELFPVATLLGGELGFGAERANEVLDTYADWAKQVPDAMASSVLLLTYPDEPAMPIECRCRHVTHVRIAYSGDDEAEALHWVGRLRSIGPRLFDTVRHMPYRDVGTIHHEPTDVPVAAFDRNVLLRDFDRDAAAVLHRLAGPGADAPFLTELRAWGGALARPPAVANAVGGRDAAFSLLAISDPDPDGRARRDGLLEAMAPWTTGMTFPNFAGVEDSAVGAVQRNYRPQDFARLQRLKAMFDPANAFRVNFNVPPERNPS